MKALPREQQQLLDLQKVDLAVARIEHQERTHPALQKLQVLAGRKDDLHRAIIASQADLDGLHRQIEKAEGEVQKVRDRRALQQSRLEEGKVPLRDMSAMEHEIASIDQRVTRLEGEVLDLMEQAEKLEGGIVAAQENAAAIEADEVATKAEVGADLVASQSKKAELQQQREALRTGIPEGVCALYDRLQSQLGTLVVIEVRDGIPVGAPVEFSLAELSELSVLPADELYVSDETEYIVVRTTA